MKYSSHFLLEEIAVAAGQEWASSMAAWLVIRLTAGPAYWLGATESRDLAEGDLIVLAPGTPGRLRASQISDVQLHGFAFDPTRLCGLLTFAERQFFANQARTAQAPARILPPEHAAAQAFTTLLAGNGRPQQLSQRAQMLAVLGALFDDELTRQQLVAAPATPASHRFRQLITRMPETELLHHSPAELAKLCGCTSRHFSRLFREQFGAPPRVRQTELRLVTASQLLLESESKIIDVAFESGYMANVAGFDAEFVPAFQHRKDQVAKPRGLEQGSCAQKLSPAQLHGTVGVLARTGLGCTHWRCS